MFKIGKICEIKNNTVICNMKLLSRYLVENKFTMSPHFCLLSQVDLMHKQPSTIILEISKPIAQQLVKLIMHPHTTSFLICPQQMMP